MECRGRVWLYFVWRSAAAAAVAAREEGGGGGDDVDPRSLP
jgi:hypothetical protein